MLKHHCSAFFNSFHPRHFLTVFHCRNNSVQHLFRRSFRLLKHHLPATSHHSFTMLKHHRSTLFDFLQIPQHQISAVLHLQYLFHLSLLLKHPPSNCPSVSFYALKSSNNRPSTGLSLTRTIYCSQHESKW
jgi:hypothetical protein